MRQNALKLRMSKSRQVKPRGRPRRPRTNRLPEWKDPKSYITKGGRHRLFGVDYQSLRLAAYQRSHGDGLIPLCECGCKRPAWWSGDRSWPDTGYFAHNEHGARKSDELHRGKWMRHECHMKSHNCDGKPVPKKPSMAL